ncbi:MAG: hypothetical protein MJ232_03090 [archaeon]|nr:hypothetical protein [archaeon]
MLDNIVHFFTSWLSPFNTNVSDSTFSLLNSFELFVLCIFGVIVVGSIVKFISSIWDSIPFV